MSIIIFHKGFICNSKLLIHDRVNEPTLYDLNYFKKHNYVCQTSNIRRTLFGNQIVDHSDVVGASPVGAAPTASSFST